MFIVLEGIDKSGKGTQALKILDYLKKEKGLDVWLTHEPTYQGLVGRLINFILKKKIKLPPLFFQKLYVLDRKIHLFEIKKQLKKGKVIVCDRYFYTTIAFGHAGGFNVSKIIKWHQKMLRPDLLFLSISQVKKRCLELKKKKVNLNCLREKIF
jgi:dTMP kinase